MITTADTLPIPRDPRHQRFADRVLAGDSLVNAYLAAGFRCTRETAHANAKKLRKRPAVAKYIRAIQLRAADQTTLTVLEKRQFLARIVRTPLMSIKPNDPAFKDGDLLKKYKRNESEHGITEEIEKWCTLKAIALDNKLSGDDSESNAMQEFADALAALGPMSVLPTDTM